MFARRSSPEEDTRQYREGYPGKKDDPELNDNLKFYSNQLALPNHGLKIDVLHKRWAGQYDTLETVHDYIQWFFPIRESSMFNSGCQELQLHEAEAIRTNEEAKTRLRRSYELMLDFFGMQLADPETGELRRNPENWKAQFRNLATHSHNNLRITRILKCLGEMGFEHYKAPFLKFVLSEVYEHQQLLPCRESCEVYWIWTLRNEADRKSVLEYIDQQKGKKKPQSSAQDGTA